MAISVCRCLKRTTMLVWVKEYIKKTLHLAQVFVTFKNYILISKKNTKMQIYGSQSSVPRDPNGVFWLTQKWLTLFAFAALIKMLCCLSMQWTKTWHTTTWSNHFCLALSISIKIYLQSLLYHYHSQEYFFNCNITSSPYLEMLLVSIIKLLFLFFLSDCNVRCCFL